MTLGADELHFMCCAQSTVRKQRQPAGNWSHYGGEGRDLRETTGSSCFCVGRAAFAPVGDAGSTWVAHPGSPAHKTLRDQNTLCDSSAAMCLRISVNDKSAFSGSSCWRAGFPFLAALPWLMLAGAIKSELAVVLASPARSYLPHRKRRMGKTREKCLQG